MCIQPAPATEQANDPTAMDKTAQSKQADVPVAVTLASNRRVLRLIDFRLLPILWTVYCLQFLDKMTLSYAAVFGLIEDTNLVGDQFSWLASIVYVAQLVFQPIVAYSLVRFPIGKFISVMVLCWGSMLCVMTAAKDFGGLMATRLLLGVFEASANADEDGLAAPTFIAVVQMWYRRREQTLRNASWYSMLGVINMLGSLLAYGLGHINPQSLKSYQVIFLFLVASVVKKRSKDYFIDNPSIFMPDSPMKAKFLKGDDKLIAIERLRMNQMGIGSGVWKWDHVRECALDPKTWLWFILMFVISLTVDQSIPSGGISTFGPLIIESFGFDRFTTILFNIPFGAVQMVVTLGGAWLSDRIRMKSPVLVLLSLLPVAGCVVLIATGRDPADRAVLLTGYYIISVYPGISPLVYSWSGQNTGGDTKRKVTTGMLFVGASAGNMVGPLLFRPSEAPRYDRGLRANLGLFVALAVLVGLGMLLIKMLNRRQAARRLSMADDRGKSRDKDEGTDDDVLNMAEENVGDRGLDDVTDLKNEDFIFVY
ncbi:hypothetical protein ACRALDRAFT_205150 [Sodiomyces alcalophilus JCM 7366]|uniref:uncharacterized protein n=1 Tax=Sodiomyces alcalophilus JCM 7366 TaxID=591952 RepID=UPI0039B5A835